MDYNPLMGSWPASPPGLIIIHLPLAIHHPNPAILAAFPPPPGLITAMVYCYHPPSVKITISRQSFERWMELYHLTQRVVRNPDEYKQRGDQGTGAIRHQKEQNPKRFTLIPAISMFGVIALTVTEENVKRPCFTHFLKYQLLPHMNPYPGLNSILVMDNACVHCGGKVAQLCDEAGVQLIYLPPYCPELCFSQVKSNLRRTQALIHSNDPEWVIKRSFYRVVTNSLLYKLYAHAGYNFSGITPAPVTPGTHFPE
ncbi:uncharacterized protein PGTG_13738 [Puccinia graminis f. sp. tritici CRL 75-36-700-3]|uniref:Tc1-like transposase DDE domain-containing protein n=1 Tax=Puccinia graminis f. sp. tritici (strain CRL 75-36-700-3 / race SCCL) TaxID=418459 RepID=E3KUI4_PUCGT|nr:uncharacterized protein PGTG_13738 [Puccinia graminis f. sp. tritici CRL 75-36-700-3]EFP87934.1 hypothetical protein PGTG_13738 [Puccinia graminis f. sp. tritici CRL 75-36-700-3]